MTTQIQKMIACTSKISCAIGVTGGGRFHSRSAHAAPDASAVISSAGSNRPIRHAALMRPMLSPETSTIPESLCRRSVRCRQQAAQVAVKSYSLAGRQCFAERRSLSRVTQCQRRRTAETPFFQLDAQPLAVEYPLCPHTAFLPFDDHAIAAYRNALPVGDPPLEAMECPEQYGHFQRRIRQHRPGAAQREHQCKTERQPAKRSEKPPSAAPPDRIVAARGKRKFALCVRASG